MQVISQIPAGVHNEELHNGSCKTLAAKKVALSAGGTAPYADR